MESLILKRFALLTLRSNLLGAEMTLSQARAIADGDVMKTNVQTLSDAFDVLRKSATNCTADFNRAKHLWDWCIA
tara:strand:+ start:3537 stop:3761 length:225 start_codon:yes stop_codon:yes gene_type:complete